MKAQATIEDLYDVPDDGKAEIVNGALVRMSPTGGKPGRTEGKIYASLDQYERLTKRGYAFPDNVGFTVKLPNRDLFSPDAAFSTGTVIDEDVLDCAPVFAIAVRSKSDYERGHNRQVVLG